MCIGQIIDMNVIPYPGAVRRRVVSAKHIQLFTFADSNFSSHLDQQGRLLGGLANAALRVGAGHIEVAQNDMTHVSRLAEIAQHHFTHQL